MLENPKCLFKTPKIDCPVECLQYFQSQGYQELDLAERLARVNELRRLDEVNVKPGDLSSKLKRRDYNIFFGCKPEDCLMYRQQVLKIP